MSQAAYKRPESVLVVVYALSGEVLLLRRRLPADFWQSVTGSLEWGEQAESAARRELAEETGLEAGDQLICAHSARRFPILPEWRGRYAPDVASNTEYLFYLPLDRPGAIRLNPGEHTEYAWLPWGEAAARASSCTNREAIVGLSDTLGTRPEGRR